MITRDSDLKYSYRARICRVSIRIYLKILLLLFEIPTKASVECRNPLAAYSRQSPAAIDDTDRNSTGCLAAPRFDGRTCGSCGKEHTVACHGGNTRQSFFMVRHERGSLSLANCRAVAERRTGYGDYVGTRIDFEPSNLPLFCSRNRLGEKASRFYRCTRTTFPPSIFARCVFHDRVTRVASRRVHHLFSESSSPPTRFEFDRSSALRPFYFFSRSRTSQSFTRSIFGRV